MPSKRMAVAELLQHGSRLALDVVANVQAAEDAMTELADGFEAKYGTSFTPAEPLLRL